MGIYESLVQEFLTLVTGQVAGVKAVAQFGQYMSTWTTWDLGTQLEEGDAANTARCAQGHSIGLPCRLDKASKWRAMPPCAMFAKTRANGSTECMRWASMNADTMTRLTDDEYALLRMLLDLWWRPHGLQRLTN